MHSITLGCLFLTAGSITLAVELRQAVRAAVLGALVAVGWAGSWYLIAYCLAAILQNIEATARMAFLWNATSGLFALTVAFTLTLLSSRLLSGGCFVLTSNASIWCTYFVLRPLLENGIETSILLLIVFFLVVGLIVLTVSCFRNSK